MPGCSVALNPIVLACTDDDGEICLYSRGKYFFALLKDDDDRKGEGSKKKEEEEEEGVIPLLWQGRVK